MGKNKTIRLTREIIGELFELHQEELYLLARRYLDEEESRDVVQEVFLKITELGEEAGIHTSVKGYLQMAVVNRCLNILTQRKRKEEYALDFRIRMLEDEKRRLEEGGDAGVPEKELLMLIRTTVASLPEKSKRIFEMSRFEGYTHRQIADRLGISIRTVETQIYRALKMLHRTLQAYTDS